MFGVFSLLVSLFFWVFWNNHLEFSLSLLPYLPGVLAFLFLLTTLNLLYLFAARRMFFLFSVLMSVLPIFPGINLVPFSFLSSALLMAGIHLSYSSFQKNKEIYKKVTIRNILQTRTSFYALALSLTVLVIGNSTAKNGSFRVTIPEETIPYLAKFSASLLNPTGDIENSATLDLAEQAFDKEIPRLRGELSKIGINDETLIRQQIESARRNYLGQVKQGIKSVAFGNEQIEEQLRIVKGLVEKELNKFLSDYIIYMPYLAGLTFFLTISFFVPLFVVGSDFLFLIVFKLLQSLKIVLIRTRSQEVEYLEM